jgi:hypothetical protein
MPPVFKHSWKQSACRLLKLVLAVSPFTSFSQGNVQYKTNSFIKNTSLGTRFYYGSFITPTAKSEYIRDSYTSLGEIYIQYQTKGNKEWQLSHQYPQWGLSFLYGNTGSRQYIGNMRALYAYANFPLLKSHSYSGSFRFGAGPGWVNKPYEVNVNPKNTIIGTKLNAYIHLMFQNEIKLTGPLFLNANLSFMHLSNGGTQLPNLGLNIPAFSAGLRYAFSDPVIERRVLSDSFTKKINYQIYTSVGIKQWPWVGSDSYLVNTLQAEAVRNFSRNNIYGAGIIFFYDRTLPHYSSEAMATPPHRNKLQAGLYASYEHQVGKLSLPLQAGVYVYNRYKSPALFQQFGLRFHFSKHLSTQVLLKTHMGKADFIHAGIGYNF